MGKASVVYTRLVSPSSRLSPAFLVSATVLGLLVSGLVSLTLWMGLPDPGTILDPITQHFYCQHFLDRAPLFNGTAYECVDLTHAYKTCTSRTNVLHTRSASNEKDVLQFFDQPLELASYKPLLRPKMTALMASHIVNLTLGDMVGMANLKRNVMLKALSADTYCFLQLFPSSTMEVVTYAMPVVWSLFDDDIQSPLVKEVHVDTLNASVLTTPTVMFLNNDHRVSVQFMIVFLDDWEWLHALYTQVRDRHPPWVIKLWEALSFCSGGMIMGFMVYGIVQCCCREAEKGKKGR